MASDYSSADYRLETTAIAHAETSTDPALPPQFTNLSLVTTVILSSMFFVSLIGNSAVLYRTYRHRHQLSSLDFLISNLAVSDLTVIFFCDLAEAIWASTVQWYAGNWLCKFVKYIQVIGLYQSTYITVIIGIDRCLAIVNPMSRHQSRSRVRAMISVSWVLSAVLSLPQLYIFRVVQGPFKESFYQCVTYGAYTARWQEQAYSTFSVLLMYILPLVAIVTTYTLILYTVIRNTKKFDVADGKTLHVAEISDQRSQFYQKAKVRSLCLTTLIVVTFIVCWTPYQLVFLTVAFSDASAIDAYYLSWIFLFGMTNSMFNPLIYGAFHLRKCHRQSSVPRNGRLLMQAGTTTSDFHRQTKCR